MTQLESPGFSASQCRFTSSKRRSGGLLRGARLQQRSCRKKATDAHERILIQDLHDINFNATHAEHSGLGDHQIMRKP